MVMHQELATSAKDNLAALTQRVAVFNVAAKIGRGDKITREDWQLLRAEIRAAGAQ